MSSPVTVTLERAVPYNIVLTPASEEFKFSPPNLTFPGGVASLTFSIVPLNSSITVGPKSFSWSKTENTSKDLFSEVPDTFFSYIATPQ
jgi:hypothetical protein